MADSTCAQSDLIEGLASRCKECGGGLCLRQQVLNLALGEDEALLCLACLAADNGKTPQALLDDLTPYILSRQCFAREWQKYTGSAVCPDPAGCKASADHN